MITLNDVDWDVLEQHNKQWGDSDILCRCLDHFKVEHGIEKITFNFGAASHDGYAAFMDSEIGLLHFPINFLATVVEYAIDTINLGSAHEEYFSLYERLLKATRQEVVTQRHNKYP